MSSPIKFAHIVYKTHRYDEMVAWYVKVFSAKIQNQTDDLCFVTYDDEHHRMAFLNLGRDSSAPPEKKTVLTDDKAGVHHVSYTWATLDELLDQYSLLKSMGEKPTYCLRHGLTLSMYYADPDGNGLEFQVDVLHVADAVAFMQGEAFLNNQIGEPFDPETIIAARGRQESLLPLIMRSDQTEPAAGFAVEV